MSPTKSSSAGQISTEQSTRRKIVQSLGLGIAALSGCSVGDNGSGENPYNPDEDDEVNLPNFQAEIEFVGNEGDKVDDLARVKVTSNGSFDPSKLEGTLNIEATGNQTELEFSQSGGTALSQEVMIQDETQLNAEITYTEEGENTGARDESQYRLTDGLTIEQREDAPGMIETRLEPDNDTPGSLENLATETLEAEARINGESQEIVLESEYEENEDGEQEFNGYTGLVNAYNNGQITEDIEIQIGEIEELEGFRLKDGKLTVTQEDAEEAINPEEFISAEQAYRETFSDGAPINTEDLDNYQNGEIQDFGQLLREINSEAPTFGNNNKEHKAAEVYKQIGHNLLDLDTDQYQVIRRTATSGVDYLTIFYRENNNEEWNKALLRGRNYEEADTTILLPDMQPEDLDNSVTTNLYGLHTPQDPTNQSALDFRQITDAHDRQNSKEVVSDERWRERTTDLDDYNDLLIPGGGEIGYTADVRGHMQELIDPRTGDNGAELELVEAASEYFQNAVPEDQYMQIDVEEVGQGEGEELMRTDGGEAFYASTVDQETHEENFMALYDPEIES